MTSLIDRRHDILAGHAERYVTTALANIEREYPHMPWLIVTAPGPLPGHRNIHPTFYGSFDWHSCVEMFWLVTRLLRLYPFQCPQGQARYTLDYLLSPRFLDVEAQFLADPTNSAFERPYGWGWLLALQAELEQWDDPDARRWAAHVMPLSKIVADKLIAWLPRLPYPQRVGTHPNTAFSLARSLDCAHHLAARGEPGLTDAIAITANRFFRYDTAYPLHYEPSGADFLSAGLTEADLMSRLLPASTFAEWLTRFLPDLTADVVPCEPVTIPDVSDGQLAHLVGLNLSRAANMLTIASHLPTDDVRVSSLRTSAEAHADVSLGLETGSDYMLEHWLSAYATLYFTA